MKNLPINMKKVFSKKTSMKTSSSKKIKILIIKTSSLGDILQSLCVVDYIYKNFPKAKIDWVVDRKFFPLIKAHPNVLGILFSKETMKEWALSLKRVRENVYDVAFDLQGNVKSGVISLAARAKDKVGYDISGVSEWPNLLCTNKRVAIDKTKNMREQYLEVLQKYFSNKEEKQRKIQEEEKEVQKEASKIKKIAFETPVEKKKKIRKLIERKNVLGPKILVCFSSRWQNKMLLSLFWKAFLGKIKEKMGGHFFFVASNKEEEKEAVLLQKEIKDSTLLKDLSLVEWQYLMKHMDLVLGVDSAGIHLAEVLGVKSFSIFGPTSAEIFRPLGKDHGAFQATCPYSRKKEGEKKCRDLRSCKKAGCLQDLNVDEVFSVFSHWYSEKK
jgi:heptosyltransferase-1